MPHQRPAENNKGDGHAPRHCQAGKQVSSVAALQNPHASDNSINDGAAYKDAAQFLRRTHGHQRIQAEGGKSYDDEER
jgi:hypothetical protein